MFFLDSSNCWKAFLLVCIVIASSASAALAQSSQSFDAGAPSVDLSSTLQSFEAEQQSLAASFTLLWTQNTTATQFNNWSLQNEAALAAQQNTAIDLGIELSLQAQAYLATPAIPMGSSQNLANFLNAQTRLANARILLHNQLLNSLPTEVGAGQVRQMILQEQQQFQAQHAADEQAQGQLSQTIAGECLQQSLVLPPAFCLPPGTTPSLAAFLTAKDNLMRQQILLFNQYRAATPAARQAAIMEWQQQNAVALQQVQTLAQNLAPALPTAQN